MQHFSARATTMFPGRAAGDRPPVKETRAPAGVDSPQPVVHLSVLRHLLRRGGPFAPQNTGAGRVNHAQPLCVFL